jgi:hypothetical protein
MIWGWNVTPELRIFLQEIVMTQEPHRESVTDRSPRVQLPANRLVAPNHGMPPIPSGL